jgi:hypothetical protein
LTLGVRQVVVKTKSGTTTTDYPLAPLSSNPGSAIGPAVGSTPTSGDQAGNDPLGRPIYPALFITDITADPNSTAGDWQSYGTAIPPSAVFGNWKGAVTTVEKTKTPTAVTITPDADPAKNSWNLGPGSDPPPAGLSNLGYGAEARWNIKDLGLKPGDAYRMEFMVHDGDQKPHRRRCRPSMRCYRLARHLTRLAGSHRDRDSRAVIVALYFWPLGDRRRRPALELRLGVVRARTSTEASYSVLRGQNGHSRRFVRTPFIFDPADSV